MAVNDIQVHTNWCNIMLQFQLQKHHCLSNVQIKKKKTSVLITQ